MDSSGPIKAILDAVVDPVERPFFAKVQARLREASRRPGESRSAVDLAVERLLGNAPLTDDDARTVFGEIIDGSLSDDRIGSLLVLLIPERLEAGTLAQFAGVMRSRATRVDLKGRGGRDLGDTCGTGSDAFGTFNVSTATAFVLAAGGARIAKHGNRAVTSQCGSADVLEELGIKIDLGAPDVARCVDEVGIGFMFAPLFHEAFKNVQRIRRALAKELPPGLQRRSVFNVLGPLSNPAGATWQIIGVYSVDLIEKFAHALRLLGVERALVPFGLCDGSDAGLDEFSTAGETHYAELRQGRVERKKTTPEELGLPRCKAPAELKGADRKGNALILREVLAGKSPGPKEDLVVLNAGAGLYLAGKADSIRDGVLLAQKVVRSGAALAKLEDFRKLTRSLSG